MPPPLLSRSIALLSHCSLPLASSCRCPLNTSVPVMSLLGSGHSSSVLLQCLAPHLTFAQLLQLSRTCHSLHSLFARPSLCDVILTINCQLTPQLRLDPSSVTDQNNNTIDSYDSDDYEPHYEDERVEAEALPSLRQSTPLWSSTQLVARLLPCLACVESRLLHSHPIPRLHLCLLLHSLLSSSLSNDELARFDGRPVWQLPSSTALWSVVRYFACTPQHDTSLYSLDLPHQMWLSSGLRCQHWLDWWKAQLIAKRTAAMDYAASWRRAWQDTSRTGRWHAASAELNAAIEDACSDMVRQLEGRAVWFAGVMETNRGVCCVGYYFGELSYSQYCGQRLAKSQSTVDECQHRMADSSVDWSTLPVVVYAPCVECGDTGDMFRVYESLSSYLLSFNSVTFASFHTALHLPASHTTGLSLRRGTPLLLHPLTTVVAKKVSGGDEEQTEGARRLRQLEVAQQQIRRLHDVIAACQDHLAYEEGQQQQGECKKEDEADTSMSGRTHMTNTVRAAV